MDETYPTRQPIRYYIKKYPDRLKLIEYKVPLYSHASENNGKKTGKVFTLSEDAKLDYLAASLQRAKTKISDLVICNAFDMFVTFTFNCRACIPKCVNKPCTCIKETCTRYNLAYVIRTQKTWYNNQIKKLGRFPYLQVMELHKDKGYHFHALFKDYLGKLKPFRIDKDGRQIYSLASNRKGYTTVKKIYDISGASSYIRKYITKDMPLFPSKKRYWASQGLLRPIITDDDPELMQAILDNPLSEVWSPKDRIVARENGTTKRDDTNIQAITTLLLDNERTYLKERAWLTIAEQSEKARKAQGLHQAQSSINRNSPATARGSLTKDTPRPIPGKEV